MRLFEVSELRTMSPRSSLGLNDLSTHPYTDFENGAPILQQVDFIVYYISYPVFVILNIKWTLSIIM